MEDRWLDFKEQFFYNTDIITLQSIEKLVLLKFINEKFILLYYIG